MVHSIDAIYDDGVLRPIKPLPLPNGTRVHLRIEEEDDGPPIVSSNCEDYDTWLDGVAGRWQGDFLRGDEGELETREPLS
jgi:predicted DNA-binding antitoxin AbrB/MazE fold protein